MSRRYRNRRIGEFLKELDLTEGRSTGIPKILRVMQTNGSPAPVFETDEDHSYFLIRLPVHGGFAQNEQPSHQVTEQAGTRQGPSTHQVTHQVRALLSGAGETIRRKLLESTNLRTILRLPTGIFYAQGVKANVLFFDNKPASPEPWSKQVWYYDYRTNIHHTLKRKPLRFEDLEDFIAYYNPLNPQDRRATWHPEDSPDGRWRSYSLEELMARDKTSPDVFWLKDKSLTDLDNLPEPDELAEEIIENLEAGLASFRAVLAGLKHA